MNILAIDTSFDMCSCAISKQGVTYADHIMAKQNHGAVILPMIDTLLRTAKLSPSDMHAITFACGPGSFTAIRMATAVAQGLALPHTIPVIPISTLTALAWHAMQSASMLHCIAAINAHMGEMYVGCYTLAANGTIQLTSPQQLIAPDQFMPPYTAHWHAVGNGFSAYGDILNQKFSYDLTEATLQEPALATTLLALATQQYKENNLQDALQLEPCYLHTPTYKKNS